MAASLLHALDLDDLISSNLKGYEQKAIALSQNPEQLNALKVKLSEKIKLSPLFTTLQFTQDLENIYCNIFNEYQAGLVR